jgi:peptidoglycan/LPS O-acetylase OafA/YrhL
MSAEPLQRLGYRPALDGLRAVAIAAVLLFHAAGLLPGGYFGVDLFFVLSGFLITTLLLEEHAARGTISLRGFYQRRALRLLPALVVLLTAFLVVATAAALVGDRAQGKDVFGVLAGLGYFSNLAMTAEPASSPMPGELRHLWSLAQEEQFYLLWPLVLIVLLRRRLPGLVLAVAAGAAGVTVLRHVQLHVEDAAAGRIVFGPDVRGLPILVGCCLALILARSRGPSRVLTASLAPFAVLCVLALFFLPGSRLLVPGPLVVFSLACAALLVVALDDRSPVARLLSTRPLVYGGRISYSLYLWHFPFFVMVGLNDPSAEHALVPSVAAVAATFACAIASYHFVELPFLRRKRRVGESQPEPRPVELASARPAETSA